MPRRQIIAFVENYQTDWQVWLKESVPREFSVGTFFSRSKVLLFLVLLNPTRLRRSLGRVTLRGKLSFFPLMVHRRQLSGGQRGNKMVKIDFNTNPPK